MPDADNRYDAFSPDAHDASPTARRDSASRDARDTSSPTCREAAPTARREASPTPRRDAFATSAAAVLAADLRAPGEDDDGYDPYSDYMDAWGRMDDEEPCEDPWR